MDINIKCYVYKGVSGYYYGLTFPRITFTPKKHVGQFGYVRPSDEHVRREVLKMLEEYVRDMEITDEFLIEVESK